jgi:cytochrome c oxidase assembly factor CtaG
MITSVAGEVEVGRDEREMLASHMAAMSLVSELPRLVVLGVPEE